MELYADRSFSAHTIELIFQQHIKDFELVIHDFDCQRFAVCTQARAIGLKLQGQQKLKSAHVAASSISPSTGLAMRSVQPLAPYERQFRVSAVRSTIKSTQTTKNKDKVNSRAADAGGNRLMHDVAEDLREMAKEDLTCSNLPFTLTRARTSAIAMVSHLRTLRDALLARLREGNDNAEKNVHVVAEAYDCAQLVVEDWTREWTFWRSPQRVEQCPYQCSSKKYAAVPCDEARARRERLSVPYPVNLCTVACREASTNAARKESAAAEASAGANAKEAHQASRDSGDDVVATVSHTPKRVSIGSLLVTPAVPRVQ